MCFAHLQPVLDTLLFIKRKTNVWLEITTLLIPGLNDSEKEIDEMTLWIAKELGVDVPLHFSAFHPDYRLLGFPPTSVNTLQRARQIAQNNGIAHVYLGNSGDLDGVHTYCSQCHKLLIKREGYALTEYRLKDRNHCDVCQTICPGYFDDNPGSWGSRRLPIRLTDH
jgi:pyruvate formate lyase activating enzyme